MNLYLEAQLDSGDPVERERAIATWFDIAYRHLFTAETYREIIPPKGTWTGSVARREDDSMAYYPGLPGTFINVLTALRNPPYWGQLSCEAGDVEVGRVRVSHPLSDGSHSIVSAAMECPAETLATPDFCAFLADFLVEATGGVNPAFGRIEYRQFSDRSNLDVALRRKPRQFLPESRRLLRGYAWATALPEELVRLLGGVEGLVGTAAFTRVVALPAGGAVLQATPTLSHYSDADMEKVFRALAPVLPAGLPRPHPAFPGVRFVPRDAAAV